MQCDDDLVEIMPGHDGGPPLYEDHRGQCYVGPDRHRHYFACEGSRRIARLSAWTGQRLPNHCHAFVADVLYITDRQTRTRVAIPLERPHVFEDAISQILRARKRR